MMYKENKDGTIELRGAIATGTFKAEPYQTHELFEAQDEYLSRYYNPKKDEFTQKNVIGCGIGIKEKNGKQTDTIALRIYVTKKEPLKKVKGDDVIPQEIGGVYTDVCETGEIKAQTVTPQTTDRKKRFDPIPMGCSIANATVTAGTAGFFVKRDGQEFILSNAHVLAEDPTRYISDQTVNVYQPGPFDDGTSQDYIGNLRYMVLVQPGKTNYVDAALCLVTERTLDHRILDLPTPPLGMKVAEVGMEVKKSGRTTGVTQGTVTDVNVSVSVNFGEFHATFAQQCLSTDMSAGGDSGSGILTHDNYAIGQLNAGNDSTTVFQPIQNILSPLRANLILADEDEPPEEPEEGVEVNFYLEPIGENYYVYGYVSEAVYGDAIEGAVIKLTSFSEEMEKHTYTDNDGRFEFLDIPTGQYIVTAAATGYLSQAKEIMISKEAT